MNNKKLSRLLEPNLKLYFLCLALFILIRRQWIASQAIRLKEWIEQKISNFKK